MLSPFVMYFSNFFPNSKLSTLSKGGRDVKKIMDFFFTFWDVFFMAPLREILSHLENIKSKIFENLTFNFCHTRAPSWILS